MRIPLPDYLLKLRRDAVRELGTPLPERAAIGAWRVAMSSSGLYRSGGTLAGAGLRLLSRRRRIRRLPPPLSAWTHGRDFPAFAPKSFRRRWKERRK